MSDIRIKSESAQQWKDVIGTAEGRVKVVEGGITKLYTTTGAATISLTTTVKTDYPGRQWKLKSFSATWSAAPTTSESLTVTLVPFGGIPNRPSTILYSLDPSVGSVTSALKEWENGGRKMIAGDEVTLAYTNTDTKTIKAEIEVEVI